MCDEVLYKGSQFMFFRYPDITILNTKENLRLLFVADRIFGDDTFSYAPKFFQQLYIIHVYKNGFYVPVVNVNCVCSFMEMYLLFNISVPILNERHKAPCYIYIQTVA